MIRSAMLILSGNAAASLLLLARNLLIARLIPVADYGVAATLAVVMAVVEMSSALGLHVQIVQSDDGDDPDFQAALQGFQLLRSLLSATALLVLAGPIADFLNVPEAAWGYRVMALVPVLNALVHFDIYRLNRQMVFWPMLLSGAAPALVSLVAVWPLAQWLGDWRVMLWAIVIQAVLATLVSRLVAERPYRLRFDLAVMRKSFRFGWPILLNGALMFLVFNGDRLIVGRALGMEPLGIFAMGVTLTLTPMLVLVRSGLSMFLPLLSAAKDEEGAFAHLAAVTIQAFLLIGFLFVAATALVGRPIVDALLGDGYAALLPLLAIMAIVQAIRAFRSGPSIVALARGYSAYDMVGNVARIATLPVAAALAATTGTLAPILWVGVAGELVGLVAVLALLPRTLPSGLGPLVWPLAGTAVGVAVAALHAVAHRGGEPVVGLGWLGLAFALVLVQMAWSMTDLRRFVLGRDGRRT